MGDNTSLWLRAACCPLFWEFLSVTCQIPDGHHRASLELCEDSVTSFKTTSYLICILTHMYWIRLVTHGTKTISFLSLRYFTLFSLLWSATDWTHFRSLWKQQRDIWAGKLTRMITQRTLTLVKKHCYRKWREKAAHYPITCWSNCHGLDVVFRSCTKIPTFD